MGDTVDFGAVRAKRVVSNDEWTPIEAMQEAIRDIESGQRVATSCLVLLYADGDDAHFDLSWVASNLKGRQMISVMEMVKSMLLRDMGMT